MQSFRERVEAELRSDILTFWLKHSVDEQFGGFRGQISNDLTIDPLAHKGLILNARILWTFAKAFSVYGETAYLETGRRALDYLNRYFWDAHCGGLFWMVDHLGHPVDTKKRIYGQAFTIYALAECHRATGDEGALKRAIEIFSAIETASHDAIHHGYFETCERDWTLSSEQRLSKVDMEAAKSMNTHLHLLEAYSNLLRCHDNPELRRCLKELIQVFLEQIIDRNTHHFRMYFDAEWNSQSDHISFGHDVEGSWLLCEAAETLGDEPLLLEIKAEALKMAQAVLQQGIDSDGGLLYEANSSGIIDTNKHWWPQAEAVVAFLNAYQLSGQARFYQAAVNTWEFIEKYIVDQKYGEWYWRVSREGVPNDDEYKVGAWKCPYHNARMCFEVMARLDKIGNLQTPMV